MYKTITYEYNDLLKTFVQIQESVFETLDNATNDLNHLSWSDSKKKLVNDQHRNQMNQKYGVGHWKYITPKKTNSSKAKITAIANTKLNKIVMYTTLVKVNDERERSKFIQDKIFEKISKELSETIQKQIDRDNPFKIN